VQTLLKTSANNAASPEVDALIVKLLKNAEITQETVVLTSKKELAGNKLYPFLQQLLLGDFEAFSASAKDLLSSAGIKLVDLERNIKIQAIPRILNGIKNASYSQVSEILKIQKEEVESYIIEAIQNGLLKAKIDEFQETILIQYSSPNPAKSSSAPSVPRTAPPSRRIYQHSPASWSRLPAPSDVYIFKTIAAKIRQSRQRY
jgi:hypothetical protein